MDKYLLFGLFFLTGVVFTSCGTTSQMVTQSSQFSQEIKAQFAPDSRTSIYAVKTIKHNKSVILQGETNVPKAKDALIAKMKAAQIAYVDEIKLLPDPTLTHPYGVVNLSVANLRSKPSVSAGLETQALMGMPLKIFKQEGHYFFVQTPEKYIKWMNAGALALMTQEEFDAWSKSDKVIFIGGFGYAYAKPDPKSLIITDLITGNILKRINTDGDFTKVNLPDGSPAFVLTEKIMNYQDWLDSRLLSPENIEKAAFSYMGAPYVWGGTSGKGLDCSGFTKNVFFQNGIMLPRDASQQVHVGKEVPLDKNLSNLQKGDLLFFGRKATANKKERVTHVGIYLGNGKFIHAGVDKAKVAVESLFEGTPDFAENRLKSLLRAKRIVGYVGTLDVETVKGTMYSE